MNTNNRCGQCSLMLNNQNLFMHIASLGCFVCYVVTLFTTLYISLFKYSHDFFEFEGFILKTIIALIT